MDKVTKDGFRIGLAAMILATLDEDQSTQQEFVTLIKTAFGLNPNGDHKISSEEIKDFGAGLEKLASDDAQKTIASILSTDVLERFITKIAGLDNSLFSRIKVLGAEVFLDQLLNDFRDLLKPDNIEKTLRELIADINASDPGALNGADIEEYIRRARELAKQLHDALPRDIDLPGPRKIASIAQGFLSGDMPEIALGKFAEGFIKSVDDDGIIDQKELREIAEKVANSEGTADDKLFAKLLKENGITDLSKLGLSVGADGELRYFDPSKTPDIIIKIPQEPAAAR